MISLGVGVRVNKGKWRVPKAVTSVKFGNGKFIITFDRAPRHLFQLLPNVEAESATEPENIEFDNLRALIVTYTFNMYPCIKFERWIGNAFWELKKKQQEVIFEL